MEGCKAVAVCCCLFAVFLASVEALAPGKGGFYSFRVKNIKGKLVSLEKYRGKVSLVVNLASECGYTDEHYRELAQLQRDLADDGRGPFTVLGFPCNQFGLQEPGEAGEIEKFARQKYKAAFPLFAKIEVADLGAHDAFKYLARESGKEPKWNFWKYLLDGQGQVIDAWGPKVSVESIREDVMQAIEELKRTHREL